MEKKAKNNKKPQPLKKAETKQALTKKALLSALKSNLGNISKACEAVGVNRSTYYGYLEDPTFQAETEAIEESNLDFAESKLRELIEGVWVEGKGDNSDEPPTYKQPPNVTATIFYLKTKGKKRGYVEKIETEHQGGIKVEVEFINDPIPNN